MKVCSLIFEIFSFAFHGKAESKEWGKKKMFLFWLLLIFVFVLLVN